MYKHQTNSLPQTFSESITILQEMPKITVFIKPKKVFANRAIRTTGPTLWNYFDSKLKYCKTAKHFRNEFKSILVNNYD